MHALLATTLTQSEQGALMLQVLGKLCMNFWPVCVLALCVCAHAAWVCWRDKR
jgi:hypothetical protein